MNEHWKLAITFVLLLAPTPVLVAYSASEEPFYGIRSVSEILEQVGLTSSLAAFSIAWIAVAVHWGVAGRVSKWWCLLAVVMLLNAALLGFCAWGYANDLVVHQRQAWPV